MLQLMGAVSSAGLTELNKEPNLSSSIITGTQMSGRYQINTPHTVHSRSKPSLSANVYIGSWQQDYWNGTCPIPVIVLRSRFDHLYLLLLHLYKDWLYVFVCIIYISYIYNI